MTEKLTVNLDRTYLFLRITAVIAGALVSFFVVYNQLDQRMDNIELSKAVDKAVNESKFESINKELGSVGDKLDKIYDHMIQSPSNSKHLASRER